MKPILWRVRGFREPLRGFLSNLKIAYESTAVDKENVQLIQKDYEKYYDFHGYGESSYSSNCHHFAAHTYYLAELYDGTLGQYSAEEEFLWFLTKSEILVK